MAMEDVIGCDVSTARTLASPRARDPESSILSLTPTVLSSAKDAKREREEHVQILESRLRAVEDQLASIKGVDSTSQPHAFVGNPRKNTEPQTSNPGDGRSDVASAAMYEGDTSFTSQSVEARELAKTMASSSGVEMGSNITGTFDSLNHLLQSSSKQNPHRPDLPRSSTQSPLPAELVLALLQDFRVRKPMLFWSYPINDLALVERLCQKVYFSTQTVFPGDLAAMHGIFHFAMKEYIAKKDPLCQKVDFEHYAEVCRKSFHTEMESSQVLVVPTLENIIALIMGMLGYHRESTYQKSQDENVRSQRRIFWTVYNLDKSMSLLMGRPSYLQDFDIDAEYDAPSTDPAIRPWDEAFDTATKLAEIKGNIYNKLYSAAARKISENERIARINELEVALHQCQATRDKIDSSQVNDRSLHEISERTWDMTYYSTLTILLRASTSSETGNEIGPKCFEAARRGLQSHLKCFPDYTESDIFTVSDFANWVLLHSSFTPFIVIFLHAIAAVSMDDVKLLDDVVVTLYHAKHVSHASERLYNVCSSFAQAARSLVDAKRSCVGQYNEQRDSLQLDRFQSSAATLSNAPRDFADMDMMSYLTFPEAQDVSSLLGSWDHGQPPAMDLFGMNLSEFLE
ncbi:fungal-specific transcription factor domain-containing protein [Penicillium capsulatum]|uniref:Fungal-specific transcription factor domain-containing protein n=1 Tax=Penicillium capsulatum TaxID=69766 RepID=A0A9W9IK34_9EURO|nr:fungal-specific transcription factor domain-containing protein [Penicillium capsulatum]